MATKHYDDRYLVIHQADDGNWLLDYCPSDPAGTKCLCYGTRAECEAALANLRREQSQHEP